MDTTDTAVENQASSPEEKELDLNLTYEVLESFPAKSRRYLIPMLQKIQDVYRYLPKEATDIVQVELGISCAQLYSVVSFYPQLRTTEPGKYIFKLCFGTACYVKGATIIAEKIHDKYHIGPGETDKSKLFTLETASCLGNCGAAPMAIVGGDTHGTIDPEKTIELCGSYSL